MVEPLGVDTDGVRSRGEIHARVAGALAALCAGSPESAGVEKSHGTIADRVTTALAAALDERSRAMSAGQRSAENLAELLHRAASAYERDDMDEGTAISTVADPVGGADHPG